MHSKPTIKILSVFLVLTLLTVLPACHKNVSSPDTSKTLDLPAGSQQIITAGNQFAWNLFGAVLQQDTAPDNKLVSPFSIYMALSMLYNGAGGATKDSIAKVLALSGIPPGQLNAVSKALIAQMPTEDSKVGLSIANSIWYAQNGPQPVPGFPDTIKNDYSGDIQSLDFSNPASVGQVNSWVARNTGNKINSIIDGFTPGEVMLLVNAIYFNGSWQYAFNANNTRDAPFYLTNGSTVNTPFMSLEQTLRVYRDPAYTLLELPYGSGKNYDMYVVLPASQQQPLAAFAATFNATTLATGLSRLDSLQIGLFLPKWESSYTIPDMLPELSMLGMGIAMGKEADFTNMYPTPVYLSQATHKTYIDVSETGTEAAAVTGLGMTATAITGPEIPAILVNHPFLYAIVEKQTGMLLFMGMMNNPSQN